METRNFYILIASIIVVLSCFWLTIYAIITLDVDIFQDPNTLKIKGSGVNGELSITLEELKSEKYLQIEGYTFDIENSVGNTYQRVYSGVSLRSILEVENIGNTNPYTSTFKFKARDGYISKQMSLTTIFDNDYNKTIIAFADENGYPLYEEGPFRSVMDQSIMPSGEVASQYSVQKLATIEIN